MHHVIYVQLQPLMNRIKEIGASYGKSPTQVRRFTYKSLEHLQIKNI